MNNLNDEPSLDKIDDYNGTESGEKKNTVKLVVLFCLLVGAVFAYLKYTSAPNDYIGTKENPGISTTKLK